MAVIEQEPSVVERPVEDECVRVLQGAIRAIERDGWWQGEAHGPDGQLCAIAGLSVALGELGVLKANGILGHRAWCYLVRAIPPVGLHKVLSVPDWNDTPGRTWPEVREVLLAAVELRRADLRRVAS